MEANLNNNRLTVRDRTYNLLTQATTYEAFSNDGFLGSQTDPTYFDSLESIHGQIHGMTGRNGHMAVVDYAAFDPVFWMHHCNVSFHLPRSWFKRLYSYSLVFSMTPNDESDFISHQCDRIFAIWQGA